MKKCTKCKKRKNISNFHKNSQTIDGRHSWCKQCRLPSVREYMKNRPLYLGINKKICISKPSGKIKVNGAPDGRIGNKLVEIKVRGDRMRTNQIEWHEWFFKTFNTWPLILYIDKNQNHFWFSNYKEFIKARIKPKKT